MERLQLVAIVSLLFAGCMPVSEGVKNSPLPPIVVVPGKAGNQMEAKVDKSWSFYHHCPKRRDWFRIWLDVWQMFPGEIECWSENLQLYHNKTTKKWENAPGVAFRVPGFGETKTVEYIDPSWWAWVMGNMGTYFAPFVEEVITWGYTRGKNLRAAPYDFRYAPHSQAEYYLRLKSLIEETYRENEHSKVVLIGHSMGGLFSNFFLNNQTQEWKDTYIRSLITLNTPWKGTAVVTHLYTSGFNWGIATVDPLFIREQQRTYETAALLLPGDEAWEPDEVLITTPEANYTVSNYDEYFKAIGYPLGHELMRTVREKAHVITHSGVESFCFYGGGIPTIQSLEYGDIVNKFPDEQPIFHYGEGDGTVNTPSLRMCNKWVEHPQFGSKAHIKHFENTDHFNIVRHTGFWQWLKDYVTTQRNIDNYLNGYF